MKSNFPDVSHDVLSYIHTPPYVCFPIFFCVPKVKYFSYIVIECAGAVKIHCDEMTMLSNVFGHCIIGETRCIKLNGKLSFDIFMVLWNLKFEMLFIVNAFLITFQQSHEVLSMFLLHNEL